MKTTRKGLFNYTTNYDGNIQVNWKLYETVIVKIENDKITLNSGGWKTRHTKNCINDIPPSEYKVYQKDFDWFIDTPTGKIEFTDNTVLNLGKWL